MVKTKKRKLSLLTVNSNKKTRRSSPLSSKKTISKKIKTPTSPLFEPKITSSKQPPCVILNEKGVMRLFTILDVPEHTYIGNRLCFYKSTGQSNDHLQNKYANTFFPNSTS